VAEPELAAIRRTAGAATAVAYLLIVLGSLVRATNSGVSCPDWPTCYGEWVLTPAEFAAIPGTGYSYFQVMLEWLHRLIAGAFLGPLILLLAVLIWLRRRVAGALPRAAMVLVALLLVQGGLGGVTVLDRNSPWSVALHLGTALLLLATLLWIAVRAGPRSPGHPVPALAPLALVTWLLAIATMLTAAITAKSGASLACSTWPLCDGALVPPLGDPLVRIHFAHRVLAAVLGLTIAASWLASRPSAPASRRLATATLGLTLGQIALGALVVVHGVPIWLAVLHQAVGVLIFITVTVLLWRAMLARSGQPTDVDVDLGGGGEQRRADGLALRGT